MQNHNPISPRLTGRHVPNQPVLSSKNVLKHTWSTNLKFDHHKKIRQQKCMDDAFLKEMEKISKEMMMRLDEMRSIRTPPKIVVFDSIALQRRLSESEKEFIVISSTTEEMKQKLIALGYTVISPTEGI